MTPHDQRERALDKARDALLKAAATAAQRPVDDGSLAFALFQAIIGLAALVKADVSDKACDIFIAALQRDLREEAGGEAPP